MTMMGKTITINLDNDKLTIPWHQISCIVEKENSVMICINHSEVKNVELENEVKDLFLEWYFEKGKR